MPRRLRLLACLVLSTLVVAAVAWRGQSADPSTDPAGPTPGLPKPLPFSKVGTRWYKGNLHTHSLWSDGDDFPEMIADWYRTHGYDFLALTDHNVLSEGTRWIDVTDKGTRKQALAKYRARFGKHWVEERTEKGKQQVRLKPLDEFRSQLEEAGKFLLIPSEEITTSFAKQPVHVNGINLRDPIKGVPGDAVPETIRVSHRAVADQRKRTGKPMLAFLNHPNFNWGVTAEDMITADELRYFEVYNGHPSVHNEGDATHASCDRIWDIVLAQRLARERGAVFGLATDDAHGYHAYGLGKVNPGRGWIMVRAPYLSPESVVRALEAGDFYASTGVILTELQRTPEELSLTIQAEPGVRYHTRFHATLADAPLGSEPRRGPDGKALPVTRVYDDRVGAVVAEVEGTKASYRLTGKERYVRAHVTSTRPHPNPYRKGETEAAWTQPAVPAGGK